MVASSALNVGKITQILKGPSFYDGIDEDDAGCSLVVGLSDVAEAFLASSVPNLQLDPLVVDSDRLNLEVDPDRGDVIRLKGVLTKSNQHVGFAYPAVSDYYQLQDLVLSPSLHYYIIMLALNHKKARLAHQSSQQAREHIRQQIRNSLIQQLENEQYPLISHTFETYWQIGHTELYQHKDTLMEVLFNTNFQELTDQEHCALVTDIFYLLHEGVIPEPEFIKFKKNEDPLTASLVACLSDDLDPEELAYWISFMSDEDKKLTFLSVEGMSHSHAKWVTNSSLFSFMLKELGWLLEAAGAYRSILLEGDQLTKKQIDESLPFIHKGLSNAKKDNGLRVLLLSIWINVLQIYVRLKESATKLEFMKTVLKYELSTDTNVFMDVDLLSDLNRLYSQAPSINLLQDQTPEQILTCLHTSKASLLQAQSQESAIYFYNSIFNLLYSNWLSRQLNDKFYRYSNKFYQTLGQFKEEGTECKGFQKLWRVAGDR